MTRINDNLQLTFTGKFSVSVSTIARIDVCSKVWPPFLDLPEVLFDFLSVFFDTSKLTFVILRPRAITGWVGARVIRQILFEWLRTRMSCLRSRSSSRQ